MSSFAPVKIYYWQIKARSYAAMAIANACGIPLDPITNPDFPELKKTLPFGQLPFIEHNGIKLAQSGAINRYLGKIGGISHAEDDARFALSEMLIAEAEDIFNLMGKANYASDKAAAYDQLFASDGAMATQLRYLENLIPEGETYFVSGPKRSTGGYCVAAAIDLAVNLEPGVLAPFPKLTKFYNAMMNSAAFAGIKDWPMYLNRK